MTVAPASAARRGVEDRGERLVVGGDRPDGEKRVERRTGAVGDVRRSQRLRRDPARLEKLQRDLAGGRELAPRPMTNMPPGECKGQRDLRDPVSSAASATRSWSATVADPREPVAVPEACAASSPSAATWFRYVFVAATACSRRPQLKNGLRQAGELPVRSLVIATVKAPPPERCWMYRRRPACGRTARDASTSKSDRSSSAP